MPDKKITELPEVTATTPAVDVIPAVVSGNTSKILISNLIKDVKLDADLADAITKKHAAGSDNQDLSGLVVKVAGASLVADTEIAKIHVAATVSGPLAIVGQAISILTSLWEKGWGEVLSPADWLTAIHLGGLWEEDADGNFMPKASPDASIDTFWEVDGSDNLVPRAA